MDSGGPLVGITLTLSPFSSSDPSTNIVTVLQVSLL